MFRPDVYTACKWALSVSCGAPTRDWRIFGTESSHTPRMSYKSFSHCGAANLNLTTSLSSHMRGFSLSGKKQRAWGT
jgi:hypothetical protein